MTEYIRKDRMLERLEENRKAGKHLFAKEGKVIDCAFDAMKDVITDEPDALVRCQNCVYMKTEVVGRKTFLWCARGIINQQVGPEGFCAWGVEKDAAD